jgi:uncharacterized protein Yka (UPF0111/DUF47 family)
MSGKSIDGSFLVKTRDQNNLSKTRSFETHTQMREHVESLKILPEGVIRSLSIYKKIELEEDSTDDLYSARRRGEYIEQLEIGIQRLHETILRK